MGGESLIHPDLNANEDAYNDATLLGELMPINRDSPIPLHHQVRNYLLGCIERGELPPGKKLLQERELNIIVPQNSNGAIQGVQALQDALVHKEKCCR